MTKESTVARLTLWRRCRCLHRALPDCCPLNPRTDARTEIGGPNTAGAAEFRRNIFYCGFVPHVALSLVVDRGDVNDGESVSSPQGIRGLVLSGRLSSNVQCGVHAHRLWAEMGLVQDVSGICM